MIDDLYDSVLSITNQTGYLDRINDLNMDNIKILTAHQPVYLPWLGLLHKIALSDTFVIFDTVQYLKKDWNNRNMIKAQDGTIWLTVPVCTKGRFTQSLREVKIDNTLPWRRKHLKSHKVKPESSAWARLCRMC